LVGHWRYTDGINTAEYFFAANGTFSGSVSRADTVIWKYAGRWQRNANTIDYTYTRSSASWIPAGTKDRDTIVESASDHYVIEARDGSRRRYLRAD
jgi:hypothetical protein